jgi:ketosteroid isomerase-like protein
MSEKNKATLLQGNAAIAAGNHEGFLEQCTDDTEWIFMGEQALKGKEAVRRYMAEAYLEPPHVTVDSLIAEGDFLTAVGEIIMKDKSGIPTHYAYCDVWTFRNGKMAALKAFVVRV